MVRKWHKIGAESIAFHKSLGAICVVQIKENPDNRLG
ncbi:hypothetical protein BQ6471_02251 [Vibrio gazogenes]|nr:hypothetical protein BQ6471_02251 [Vibrio gazogenes]